MENGRPVRGLLAAAGVAGVQVFHAATRSVAGTVVSDGGRVLAVTALGDSLAKAKLQAYAGVREIRWQGAWCRKDISDKALAFEWAAAADAFDPDGVPDSIATDAGGDTMLGVGQ